MRSTRARRGIISRLRARRSCRGLPKSRRFGGYSAYSEGWGLYTERLAKEMGGYTDPYSEFGMLSLQMWRAIRLVTDTGLHSKRWSREQAIEYFRDQFVVVAARHRARGQSLHQQSRPGDELHDRPAQDRRVAQEGRDALGAKFDIRDFHEVVLGNGAVPLGVLEEEVDRYIAAKRR